MNEEKNNNPIDNFFTIGYEIVKSEKLKQQKKLLENTKDIKELIKILKPCFSELDECYILIEYIDNLQQRIDKAIEYLEESMKDGYGTLGQHKLLSILKGENNE